MDARIAPVVDKKHCLHRFSYAPWSVLRRGAARPRAPRGRADLVAVYEEAIANIASASPSA